MVKIFVADRDIRIVTPHKVLSRNVPKDGASIDELMLEVLSKCNDSEIELIAWTDRYKYITKNKNGRDVESKLAEVLESKNVKHRIFTENEWADMKKQMDQRLFNELIEKKIQQESEENAEDPFA